MSVVSWPEHKQKESRCDRSPEANEGQISRRGGVAAGDEISRAGRGALMLEL